MSSSLPRPSPDALLAMAEREERGRLKIFFGAAPGVGKTFAMLQAGAAAQAEGRDVAVGLVETHGRAETAALLGATEVLPRRRVPHMGRIVEEFDLDAALARRPDLLLLDELAHTNAPDSRHPKRWQDVQELLEAGIDVWTTLNVQHLESVNDIVLRVTGVRVRETVPDAAFEKADEIVLVDLPPDELLKRLAEGKVYLGETALRARDNFFRPQNLAALRELALRRAAERVDSDLVERMQGGAIEGPWPAGERLLACVGADAFAEAVVRRAKRLADQIGAPLTVVTVERPGERPDPRAAPRLGEIFRLAEALGADAQTLVGADVPDTILKFARFENVTQIVVGPSRGGMLAQLLRRTLPQELIRRAEGISVHVLTAPASPTERRPMVPRASAEARPYLVAAGGVVAATALGEALSSVLALPNLSMVYLMAVLSPAILFGVWPAIFASGLSFLAYNFFFIEPVYTFTVAQPYELLSLIVFLIIAVITSAVAGRAREQARASAARVRATRRLYEFTRRLSAVTQKEAVAEVAAAEIHGSVGRGAVVLDAGGAPDLLAAWPPETLDERSLAAARWAIDRLEPAGAGTGTLPETPWLFLPLRTGATAAGAVGVAMSPATRLPAEERALLESLVEQTAAALQRTALAEEGETARHSAEAERVRNTLLASVSHDFRTPLAAILGAASALSDLGEAMDESTRRSLLGDIREEAEHLDGMVRNLLSITRVEAGALELNRSWVDLPELAHRVVAQARRRGAGQRFSVTAEPGLPLVLADQGLIDQALANLVGNAVRHAGPTASIRVALARRGEAVALAVEDDGPGIPAGLLPQIFEKFARGRAAGDSGEGVGLGLAIARGIAEAHGGTLAVESPAAEGRGARFTLTLPTGGAPAP
ncbi:MAG: sensor histidine kinase KdpD [Alsobacter sp.]